MTVERKAALIKLTHPVQFWRLLACFGVCFAPGLSQAQSDARPDEIRQWRNRIRESATADKKDSPEQLAYENAFNTASGAREYTFTQDRGCSDAQGKVVLKRDFGKLETFKSCVEAFKLAQPKNTVTSDQHQALDDALSRARRLLNRGKTGAASRYLSKRLYKQLTREPATAREYLAKKERERKTIEQSVLPTALRQLDADLAEPTTPVESLSDAIGESGSDAEKRPSPRAAAQRKAKEVPESEQAPAANPGAVPVGAVGTR